VGAGELERIEREVNRQIENSAPIQWATIPLRDAREAGAMMLFGEKYPDPVRMVSMGDFSRELCGGTHLSSTSQVQRFELVSEEGISSGTRRIVALTGPKARENAAQTEAALVRIAQLLGCAEGETLTAVKGLVQEVRERKKQLASGSRDASPAPAAASHQGTDKKLAYGDKKQMLRDIARLLNVPVGEAPERVAGLVEERGKLAKQLAELSEAGVLSDDHLLEQSQWLGDIRVVIAETPGAHPNLMRSLIDQMRRKASPLAALLAAATDEGKVVLIAGVSAELMPRGAHAGNWVREVAQALDGSGGGKPDMAQAGGKSPEKLPQALQVARQALERMLQP
jgi:alanyl-tRNA synthetase